MADDDAWAPPPQAFRLRDVIKLSAEEVEAAPVSCGTCPVSMSCIAGEGGTGYVFTNCCGATTLYLQEKPKKILSIDCSKHNFERTEDTKEVKTCALCSGGVMELEAREKAHQVYLPTVHAKVPLGKRIEVLGAALTEAETKLRMEKAEEEAAHAPQKRRRQPARP